ncbi:MAG: carbohydrate ABC transporter permease, partial [Candidatus Krumholzibacteria bacterium]
MKRTLQIILLLAIFAVMAYPLVWMVSISLRTGEGISPRFYAEVWQAGPFDRYLLNSTVVVVAVLIGNILICSMAGYAFARYRFRGRRVLFFLVISMIMVPKQVILVPLYILMQKLHLLDTYAALILPF